MMNRYRCFRLSKYGWCGCAIDPKAVEVFQNRWLSIWSRFEWFQGWDFWVMRYTFWGSLPFLQAVQEFMILVKESHCHRYGWNDPRCTYCRTKFFHACIQMQSHFIYVSCIQLQDHPIDFSLREECHQSIDQRVYKEQQSGRHHNH